MLAKKNENIKTAYKILQRANKSGNNRVLLLLRMSKINYFVKFLKNAVHKY